MRRALRLARRGAGRVEPNPLVGCVLVRGGRIIGEGHHGYFGGPHAEVEALRRARASPAGSTAYVTLEPCCYFGKTPPCVEALVRARVARVVAAVLDPNPRVNGAGVAALRKVGVRVEVGLLAREAQELNAPFFKWARGGGPWVILKWAQSLDGKLATAAGDSKWISDEAARAHAHRVRGQVGAIMVGSGTVLADDPQLTCRVGRPRRVAARVILDGRLRTPMNARLLRDGAAPTWLYTTPAAARRSGPIRSAGCEVLVAPRSRAHGLALPKVLRDLAERGVSVLLVEGGAALLSSFLRAGLGDEAHVYLAPCLIGGSQAPAPLANCGARRVADALQLGQPTLRRLGAGWLLRASLSDGITH